MRKEMEYNLHGPEREIGDGGEEQVEAAREEELRNEWDKAKKPETEIRTNRKSNSATAEKSAASDVAIIPDSPLRAPEGARQALQLPRLCSPADYKNSVFDTKYNSSFMLNLF